MTATRVRAPAVAGSFYPDDPDVLARQVDALLDAVPVAEVPAPKAFVLPHAGYVYSGPIAATGYAMLRDRREPVTHVVLLGPAHYVPGARAGGVVRRRLADATRRGADRRRGACCRV